MKNKEEIYLNLSELSEEEQKEVFEILPKPKHKNQYLITSTDIILDFDRCRWWVYSMKSNKTEVNLQDFKEIMGVEGENLLMSDLEYWKTRCLLAEQCLLESPCDPDITSLQIKAHNAYNKFLSHFGDKLTENHQPIK